MISKLDIDPTQSVATNHCIINKINEVIDWIDDVSALRVTDKQVTANLPNIDAGELAFLSKENSDLKDELERTRKALGYCIKRFKSLENVLDEKAEASDIPDNPDLYAWAVRIKTIWSELKEITGTDYKTEHK